MKHSAVRQTIIETASDLFYHNGYNLTGINEVIQEAGIAKATLYNHFKSKDDLCSAYLTHKHTLFLTSFDTYVNKRTKGKNGYYPFSIFSKISIPVMDLTAVGVSTQSQKSQRKK